MLVDSCLDTYHNGYTLTEVHHHHHHHHHRGRVLRVRIRRDQLAEKSFALVEVLTPLWTWTELAGEPPSRWHVDTPPAGCADDQTLTGLVEALRERAAAILAPPGPTGDPGHPPPAATANPTDMNSDEDVHGGRQPVHEPSARPSGATGTVPLTPSSWDAVVKGLQRAADWTEGDIECDDCRPDRPCELHTDDRAEIRLWRELASRIDAVAPRRRGTRQAR